VRALLLVLLLTASAGAQPQTPNLHLLLGQQQYENQNWQTLDQTLGPIVVGGPAATVAVGPPSGGDDTPAIQSALTGGNRRVALGCGTFSMATLLLSDNTELAGSGPCTILKHNNVTASVPTFNSSCVQGANENVRDILRNAANKCGNTNLYVHDLTLDGSNITVPPNPPTINQELAMDFQGVTNTKLERVVIQNVPQDGIYFRNGFKNAVRNCIFDGTSLQWGNGGAVNYETKTDTANASQDPLLVEDSTFILDGPAFCDNNAATKCDADGTCGGGTCIGGGSVAISATGAIDNAVPPALTAVHNTIRLSNYHVGIVSSYGRNVKIIGNDIRAVPTRAGGLTGVERRMRGIHFFFTASGTRPTNRDAIIADNTIVGDTSVTSLTASLPTNRVQGCIYAQGDLATTNGVVIANNTCRDFSEVAGEVGIADYQTVGSVITGNVVMNIQNGDAAIRLGNSAGTMTNVNASNNVIGPTTGASTEAFQIQNVTGSSISDNIYTGLGSTLAYALLTANTVLIDDRATVTFANLPTVGHLADGSMFYCSNCTIASPCASGGTGAFAKHINGAWVCN